MKIAICFYGYFGNINIYKLDRLSQLFHYKISDYNEYWSINHTKKFILQNYDVDIFFHTWHVDDYHNNILLNNYKPKKYLIENQNIIEGFHKKWETDKNFKANSWIYTQIKSIELMLEYQEENNFEYDLVMNTQFDQLFFTPIEFDKLDKNFIYNSYWNSNNPIIKNNINYENNKGLYEQWYISNPNYIKIINNNLKKFFKLYPLNKYGFHKQRLKLIEKYNLKNKLRFYLYVGIDHVKCNQIFTPQYRHLLEKCLN